MVEARCHFSFYNSHKRTKYNATSGEAEIQVKGTECCFCSAGERLTVAVISICSCLQKHRLLHKCADMLILAVFSSYVSVQVTFKMLPISHSLPYMQIILQT
ncbi:hypothetical protein XENORESO_011261 [Xenotaenia resolanae]|uniref:Uncharacterized protein n=1 Tax=Xenotaenia resolanae TaxID=208358 RepID=A0ABV0VXT1_9TELE